MTRGPAGTRSQCSWAASPSPSRLVWLSLALGCLMGSPRWMILHFKTVRCPQQWQSAPRRHISTACIPKRVWSACSYVTLWTTVGTDQMKRNVVSVPDGYIYYMVEDLVR